MGNFLIVYAYPFLTSREPHCKLISECFRKGLSKDDTFHRIAVFPDKERGNYPALKKGRCPHTPKRISEQTLRIQEAINTLNPTHILLFGEEAIKAVVLPHYMGAWGTFGMDRWYGTNIPNRDLNCWVSCLRCPLRIDELGWRYKAAHHILRGNLVKALELKGRPYPYIIQEDGSILNEVPYEEDEIKLVHDPDTVNDKLNKYISGSCTCAFDYETTGLKPDREYHKILSASICWEGQETIAFSFTPDIVATFKEFLKADHVKKIAANLKYEHRWSLSKLNTEVKGWYYDTMIGAHVLNNAKGGTGLKFQSYVNFGINGYEEAVVKYIKTEDEADSSNGKNRLEKLDKDILLLYNGLDSLLEYRLAELQLSRLMEKPNGHT